MIWIAAALVSVAAGALWLTSSAKKQAITNPGKAGIALPGFGPDRSKIQIGDLVHVTITEVEPVAFEDRLPTHSEQDNFDAMLQRTMGQADAEVLSTLQMSAMTNPAKAMALQVTSRELSSSQGPLRIGVLMEPILSFRLPFVFEPRHVQRVTRDGVIVG